MITFSDIPGRDSLKKRLSGEILSGHAGHAYIFEGPPGCGKRSIARAFAYMFLCMSESDEMPCGKCRHCTIVNAGGTGELYELSSVKGSISVKSIRELQDNINLLPVSGNRKVYLIAEADTMTVSAQNCILKTLEEPPAYAAILMTVTKSDSMIETIRSRSVTLQVGINSIEEIQEYLKIKTDFNADEISIASRCANGSIGKAMDIISSEDFTLQRNTAVEFLSFLISKEFSKAHLAAQPLSKSGKEVFYSTLAGLTRDMLVMKTTDDTGYLINSDKKDIIIKGSERYPGHILGKITTIINQASDRTAANASARQTMDSMIVRITEELAGW